MKTLEQKLEKFLEKIVSVLSPIIGVTIIAGSLVIAFYSQSLAILLVALVISSFILLGLGWMWD